MNNNNFVKNQRVADHFSNLCDALPPPLPNTMTSHYIQDFQQQCPPYTQYYEKQQQQDYQLVYPQQQQQSNYYNGNYNNNPSQPMINAAASLSSIHRSRQNINSSIHHHQKPNIIGDSVDNQTSPIDNHQSLIHSGSSSLTSSDGSSPSLEQPSSPIDSLYPSSSANNLDIYNFTGSSSSDSLKSKLNVSTSSSSNNLMPLSASIPNFHLHQSIDAQADYDSLREAWKKTRDISLDLTKISKQAGKSEFTLVDSVNSLQKEYENLGNLIAFMTEKANNLKNDERLKKKKKESDRNAEKRKKRREATMLLNNVCKNCNTTDTPEWRKGPDGTKSLCNACGLHYAKNLKRETMNQPNPVIQPKETMKVLSILN